MIERTDLKGVHVLVIDDNPDHLNTFTMLLGAMGATFREARTAQEAIDAYSAVVPDVILSDLMMPGVDGLGLMRRLRSNGVKVPAIALSANYSLEARMGARLAGFDLHLAKPVTPGDLFAAIRRVLP